MTAFVFSMIFALATIVLFCCILVYNKKPHQQQSLFVVLIPLAFSAFSFMFAIFIMVPTGHVGIEKFLNKVNLDVYYSEGLHTVSPFVAVEYMDIRTQNYTDSAVVLSSDGMSMALDITAPFRLLVQYAALTYQKFGENWEEVIVEPSIRGAIRDATARYQATNIISVSRDSLQVTMTEVNANNVAGYYKDYLPEGESGIITNPVNLRDLDPPQKMKDAIENKLKIEQEAEQMAFTIEKEKLEADRKRIEAQGIQDFQTIVAKGISDKLLTWKKIEASVEIADKISKSPNAKIIFSGSDQQVPIILGK